MPYVSNPRFIQFDELRGLKLGERFELNQGCGIGIEGTQAGSGYDTLKNKGLSWVNNGEFAWGGLGSRCGTGLQVSQYGGEYDGATVAGNRGTVKRVAYTAPATDCCAVGYESAFNMTCDPKYRDLSTGECDSIMTAKCSENPDTARCKSWLQARPVQAQAVLDDAQKKVCVQGDNIKGTNCLSWLSQRGDAVKAWYDQAVREYCKTHPTDQSFCACYNLPQGTDQFDQIKNQPYCYITSCSNGTGAYKSASMSGPCAAVQICQQSINVNSMSESEIKKLELACNQSSSNVTPGSLEPTTSIKDLPKEGTTSSSTSNALQSILPASLNWMYVVAFIVICMMMLCGSSVLAAIAF